MEALRQWQNIIAVSLAATGSRRGNNQRDNRLRGNNKLKVVAL